MHQVVIADPWFGSYLKVMNWGSLMPSVHIGPCLMRTYRQESIRNYGMITDSAGIREKNCHHKWVGGLVTGQGGQTASGLPVLKITGDQYENTVSQFSGKLLKKTEILLLGSNDSSGYRDLMLSGSYTETYKGNITQLSKYWVKIRCKVHVDPSTGGVSLVDPVCILWQGSTNPTVVTESCPLEGGGSDNLGGHLMPIAEYIRQTTAKGESVGDFLHVRDEAIWQAIQNLQLTDINWLSDFDDFAQPLSVARQIGQFFRSTPTALATIKKMANFHLFWKYVIDGDIITVEESNKLLQYLTGGARKIRDKVVDSDLVGRGSCTETVDTPDGTVTIKYTAKAVFDSGWGPFGALSRWRRLGLLPGASDVWDNIPYSFVIDWCIPVQASLNKAEAMADVLTMNLKYLVLSKKVTGNYSKQFSVGGHSFVVNAEDCDYVRTVRSCLPGNMSYGNTAWSDPRKHSLTGLALLVQRHPGA